MGAFSLEEVVHRQEAGRQAERQASSQESTMARAVFDVPDSGMVVVGTHV